jgi:hypothetical protein
MGMIQIHTKNTAILITTLLLSTIEIGITYTETVTAQTNNNMTVEVLKTKQMNLKF